MIPASYTTVGRDPLHGKLHNRRSGSPAGRDPLPYIIVSGPVDDCESSEREDDATEMWSIENDEQGLPNPVEYGVVPEGALENVSATELTSGSCYQWWMASSFAEQWGRFTAP